MHRKVWQPWPHHRTESSSEVGHNIKGWMGGWREGGWESGHFFLPLSPSLPLNENSHSIRRARLFRLRHFQPFPINAVVALGRRKSCWRSIVFIIVVRGSFPIPSSQ